MLEKLEDRAQPLDDDSDLEYDLEAFPSISTEASAEATACVKVSDINCILFKVFLIGINCILFKCF